MGVCLSQELETKDTSQLSKFQISPEFRHSFLLSSKQLHPGEDTARQLLALYYDHHKLELDPALTDLYIDALSFNSEKLITLNFNSYELSLRQVKFLSIILPYCTELHRLDISFTNTNSTGIKYITKAFPKIESLVELNLAGNFIEKSGFEYFAKGVKYLKKLTVLDLSDNKIDLELMKVVMNGIATCESLKELLLNRVGIDNERLLVVLEGLQNLKVSKVSMQKNEISEVTQEEILCIGKLNLEFLDMSESMLKQDSHKILLDQFQDLIKL